MTTRRGFVTATALIASSLTLLKTAFAQASQAGLKQADFLFVQSAKGLSLNKAISKLTLLGFSPTTVLLTDRPERIAGNRRRRRLFRSGARERTASSPIRPTPTSPFSPTAGSNRSWSHMKTRCLMTAIESTQSRRASVSARRHAGHGTPISASPALSARPLTIFSYADDRPISGRMTGDEPEGANEIRQANNNG
jgi:hypothetical protein